MYLVYDQMKLDPKNIGDAIDKKIEIIGNADKENNAVDL